VEFLLDEHNNIQDAGNDRILKLLKKLKGTHETNSQFAMTLLLLTETLRERR
jgi:hypothetical protein